MSKFLLNLISFLCISLGLLFLKLFNNTRITNEHELTKEQIRKANNLINYSKLFSLISIIIGIGIIIARIFS